MKGIRKTAVAIGLVLIGSVFGATITGLYAMFACGPMRSFSRESAEDLWQLRRFAYLAEPAISALEDYHSNNGSYPMDFRDLTIPYYPNYPSDMFHHFSLPASSGWGFIPRCNYHPFENGESYLLEMKMNFDGGLVYRSRDRKWTYRQELEEWSVFGELGFSDIRDGPQGFMEHQSKGVTQ